MKDLHLPFENGIIPLIEIAKIVYPDWHEEYDYISNPEFHENMLLTRVIGNKHGCCILEYLFYENNQVKTKVYDNYWTGDVSREWVEVIDTDPILIHEKLTSLFYEQSQLEIKKYRGIKNENTSNTP